MMLESAVGEGSTFSFKLEFDIAPEVVRESMPEKPPEPAPATSKSSGSATYRAREGDQTPWQRVLVVDNSVDNRLVVTAFLAREPIDIFEAVNGEKALELLRDAAFDLVLMDLHMPVMEGLTAVGLLRELEDAQGRRRTSVIALTADALADTKALALASGCDAYMSKPLNKTALTEVVRQFLAEAANTTAQSTESDPVEEHCVSVEPDADATRIVVEINADMEALIPQFLARREQEVSACAHCWRPWTRRTSRIVTFPVLLSRRGADTYKASTVAAR
ncbi:MAG: CheY-like chemotaxis protein [Planctomycetota bacterium]